jgi:hypothetical protein
VLLVP